MTHEAKETINDFLAKGFDPQQIKDALEDGECLASQGISQEIAEEIHTYVSNCNQFKAIVIYSGHEDEEVEIRTIWGVHEADIDKHAKKVIAETGELASYAIKRWYLA